MTFSVWRLEPGGAEGQLESMATGTPTMLPLWLEKAQVLSRVVLHNGNCTMADQAEIGRKKALPVMAQFWKSLNHRGHEGSRRKASGCNLRDTSCPFWLMGFACRVAETDQLSPRGIASQLTDRSSLSPIASTSNRTPQLRFPEASWSAPAPRWPSSRRIPAPA